ncbi:MAG: hypothetical protein H3C58_09885 [Fimbriimonadaceae bacterium]|nr:hypothetical protein [Fimbriimonadaceae bacterium]
MDDPLTCGQLHGTSCEAQLEPLDRFCPVCGRRTVAVEFFQPEKAFAVEGVVELPVDIRLKSPGRSPDCEVSVCVSGGKQPVSKTLRPQGESASFKLSVPVSDGEGALNVTCLVHEADAQPEVWSGREHRRTSGSVLYGSGDVKLLCEPGVLIFRNASDSATLKVCPEGMAEYHKIDIELHGSLSATPSTGTEVSRAKPLEIKVRPAGNGSGVLGQIQLSSGRARAEVPVLMIADEGGGFMPEMVFAIDFGSAGISIWRKLLAGGTAVAVGPDRRFSSDVYIGNPSSPGTWRYGADAVSEYKKRGSGKLIRNLKSLVRSDPGESRDGWPSPQRVLNWLFEELFHKWIKPAIYQVAEQPDRDSVMFAFTLPPLDSGDTYRVQHDAMMQAIEAAGFHKWGQVRTMLEPEAALMHVIASNVGLPPDGHVLVVDSGAGTTDLTVGRLSWSSGAVRLDDVSSTSAQFPELFDAGKLPSVDVGGETVTLLLVPAIFSRLAQLLPADQRSQVSKLILDLARVAGDRTLEDSGFKWSRDIYDHQGCFFPHTQQAWHKKFSGLVGWLDAQKVALSKAPDSRAETIAFKESNTVWLCGRDLQESGHSVGVAVRNFSKAFLDDCGVDKVAICCVGGNSELSEFREKMAELVQAGTPIDLEDRRLAVVKGALTLADGKYAALGYGLRATVVARGNTKLLWAIDAEAPLMPRSKSLTVQGPSELIIEVSWEDNAWCLHHHKFPGADGPYSIAVSVRESALQCEVSWNESCIWSTNHPLP